MKFFTKIEIISIMETKELTESTEDSYEEFLHTCDESLFYYSVKYKELLIELLSCKASYWLALEGGNVVGVLPLMYQDGRYGRIWNSLPYYGSNGGIIAKTNKAYEGLCKKYNSIISNEDVAASTIIANPLLLQDKSQILFDVVDHRISQITPLSSDGDIPEKLLSFIAGTARRNIKKALSNNISVRIDNNMIDFLEVCHKENMEEIGGRAKKSRFFALLKKHFVPGKDYNIYIAERDGKTISALLLFYYNKTVEYYMPVTIKDYRNLQPMALILYQAIVDASRLGYSKWNWGGTWLSQEGVYNFKKKWGAIDRPYRYYTKINNRRLFNLDKAEILQAYNDFFIIPFGLL